MLTKPFAFSSLRQYGEAAQKIAQVQLTSDGLSFSRAFSVESNRPFGRFIRQILSVRRIPILINRKRRCFDYPKMIFVLSCGYPCGWRLRNEYRLDYVSDADARRIFY